MLSAKGISRYFAAWGWIRTVKKQKKTGFALLTVAVVAGARAATQTGQFDSVWFE
jgi:hypothetical protein